jgi:hypothetical protein
MSTLGKVLAFVNVLGAIVLAALAALDYGKRQQWAYAVFRSDLVINGLPVDDDQRDAEGRPIVRELGDPKDPGQTLKELFPSNPVATQVEEVQRVRQLLDNKIGQAGDEAAQTKLRARILLPLVETVGDRERLWAIMREQAPRPEDVTYAQAELEKAFQAAQGSNKADIAGRRRAIAHLLLNVAGELSDEPPADPINADLWQSPTYTRALTVVGLEAAVNEMEAQAQRLNRISRDLADLLQGERGRFIAENKELIDQLQREALHVKSLNDLLTQKKEQAEKQEELVRQREADIKAVSAELATARQNTDKTLKELQTLGQSLFDARVKLREGIANNQQLEQKLRDVEKNR